MRRVFTAGTRSAKETFRTRQAPPEPPVERKHVVDAAIVRVMKARKQLDHNTLLEEVFRQCTLSPEWFAGVQGLFELCCIIERVAIVLPQGASF